MSGLTDTLVTVVVVGGLIFVAEKVLGGAGAAGAATGVGEGVGATVGNVGTGVVQGLVNAITCGPGFDLCTAISQWRQMGAPAVNLLAIPGLPDLGIGGGDPQNWGTFRSYLFWSCGGADPGQSPPGCW